MEDLVNPFPHFCHVHQNPPSPHPLKVQQRHGGCTVEIVAVRDVGEKHPSGTTYTYSGPTDNSANASVVLSSTLIAARGPVTLRPNATFLRLLLLPQTANTFDVVDANVSRTGPNTPPVANAQSVTTEEDAAKAIVITGADVENSRPFAKN